MKLHTTHRKYLGILVIFFILAMVISFLGTKADEWDTISGSFQLNATPAVTSVDFVDNAYALTSTITPSQTANQFLFGVNFTITHAATIDDLLNFTVYIFDDSVHGADYDTASPNGQDLILINWEEDSAANGSSGYWLDQGATYNEWTYNDGNTVTVATAADTNTVFEFSVQFDISWAAFADTDWNTTVHVFDDDFETDADAETGLVTLSESYEINFSAATLTWGSAVVQASTNNTHEAITLQFRANAQWEIRMNASDFSPNGQDIDGNDILVWDLDGAGGGVSQALRTGAAVVMLSTWDNQGRMTTEANLTRSVFIFLNELSLFEFGVTHTTIIGALLVANA